MLFGQAGAELRSAARTYDPTPNRRRMSPSDALARLVALARELAPSLALVEVEALADDLEHHDPADPAAASFLGAVLLGAVHPDYDPES